MSKSGDKRNMHDEIPPDEILPEYDFSTSRPNKYAPLYSEAGVVVTLDADIADVFPGAKAANEALRTLADLVRKQRDRETATKT